MKIKSISTKMRLARERNWNIARVRQSVTTIRDFLRQRPHDYSFDEDVDRLEKHLMDLVDTLWNDEKKAKKVL